jgi:hypothetical protein
VIENDVSGDTLDVIIEPGCPSFTFLRKSASSSLRSMRGCLRISVPLSSNAPCELVDEETIVWRDVVEAMPAEHFIPANYPILTQLCRHVWKRDG